MFKLFKKRSQTKIEKAKSEAAEYLIAVEKLTEMLYTTTQVNRFFPLYQRILDLIDLIKNIRPDEDVLEAALSIERDLLSGEIVNSYFDRCLNECLLQIYRDDIITYRSLIPEKSYEYFVRLSGLEYEQYIYCKVDFGDGKTYYYICEFDDIEVGATVVVPAGINNEEKLAKVTDVCIYRYDEVPYPISKTKTIISQIC